MKVEQIIEKVAHGATCKVDIRTCNVWLTQNGTYHKVAIEPKEAKPLQETLNELEILYWLYKHSKPTTATSHKRKTWFRPLPIGSLTEDDMNYGIPRNVAQATLELRFVEAKMNGSLYWDEAVMGDKWFYHGEDADFIILKDFVQKA